MALAAGLQVTEILDSALLAFRKQILPLRLFANAWRKQQAPLLRGDTMKVPYYPLEAVASKDWVPATGYDFTNAGPNADTRDIAVNKRKYQPLVTTSAELSRYNFDPVQLGTQKGRRLALDVVSDILSCVTLANFGAAAFVGASSTFDADDVVDLQTAANLASWPEEMRSLILATDYYGSLLKDNAIQAANAYGSTDPIREGKLARLSGFDMVSATGVPANGQDLVGFCAYPSAILCGFSPIEPAESVRQQMSAYECVEDSETGIFIEYRAWGSPDSDQHKEVIECNYGYAVGEAAALKRITSA